MSTKSFFSLRIFISTSQLIVLLTCFCQAAPTNAQDTVNGAIWKFTMKPKTPNLEAVKGQFRVLNNRVYQKESLDVKEFKKLVGTNRPKKGRTTIAFTNLRAIDRKRNWHKGFKGHALLKLQRFGNWTGRFVDSKGRHWDFTCIRVQE